MAQFFSILQTIFDTSVTSIHCLPGGPITIRHAMCPAHPLQIGVMLWSLRESTETLSDQKVDNTIINLLLRSLPNSCRFQPSETGLVFGSLYDIFHWQRDWDPFFFIFVKANLIIYYFCSQCLLRRRNSFLSLSHNLNIWLLTLQDHERPTKKFITLRECTSKSVLITRYLDVWHYSR